jgi:hypothetical protein
VAGVWQGSGWGGSRARPGIAVALWAEVRVTLVSFYLRVFMELGEASRAPESIGKGGSVVLDPKTHSKNMGVWQRVTMDPIKLQASLLCRPFYALWAAIPEMALQLFLGWPAHRVACSRVLPFRRPLTVRL